MYFNHIYFKIEKGGHYIEPYLYYYYRIACTIIAFILHYVNNVTLVVDDKCLNKLKRICLSKHINLQFIRIQKKLSVFIHFTNILCPNEHLIAIVMIYFELQL